MRRQAIVANAAINIVDNTVDKNRFRLTMIPATERKAMMAIRELRDPGVGAPGPETGPAGRQR